MWSYIMFILDSPKDWDKAEKREDNRVCLLLVKVYMETILDLL